MKTLVSKSIQETISLGISVGRLVSKGDIIALSGELGSGKTTLIKGIAEGLEIREPEYVNSPSFVIVKEYTGRLPLYHFDVYRLDGSAQLDTVGYKEYFYGDGVTVIEWADRIKEILPDEYLSIRFSIRDQGTREIKIEAYGKRYKELLEELIK